MAGNIAPKMVLDGLLMYLDAGNTKSYISGSTTWNTLSKGSINGTLTNGPTFSSANGGSIVFDAIDDAVGIGVGNNWFPISTSAVTFDVWVKSPGLVSGSIYNGIISLTYGLTLSLIPSGYVFFRVYDSSLLVINNLSSTGVNCYDGKWHHIVGTNNGVTSTIYIDGVFNISTSHPFYGGTNPSWYSNTSICRIGEEVNNSDRFFNGNISIVKVYNKALSAQEVLQNYNATKSRYI
jgi:hypothetical protein